MISTNSPFDILVTRPTPYGEALTTELEKLGFHPKHLPLITFKEDDRFSVQQKASILAQSDVWIFISQQAVHYCFKQLDITKCEGITDKTLIAVGKATQQSLQRLGLKSLIPEPSNSEGILSLLDKLSIKADTSIALIRGNKGRELLQHHLNINYQLHELPLYKRQAIAAQIPPLTSPTALVITSAQLLELATDLLNYAKLPLESFSIISASRRITHIAKQMGYTSCYTANSAANIDLIDTCLAWQSDNNREK